MISATSQMGRRFSSGVPHDLMEAGAIKTVTSTVALIEVLVQPLAKGE
jgi:hypothetical protein